MSDPRTAEERLLAYVNAQRSGHDKTQALIDLNALLLAANDGLRAALAVEPVPVPEHDDVPYPDQCQACNDAHYGRFATPPEPKGDA